MRFIQVTFTELKLLCGLWCQYLRLWFRKLGSCVCSNMDDPAMDYSSQWGGVLHAQSTVSHTPMNLWDEHDVISWRRSWSHAFPLLRYSVVKRADNEQLLLVATDRMNSLASKLGTDLESLGTFAGRSTGQNRLKWCHLNWPKHLSAFLSLIFRVRSWRWSLSASHNSFKRSAFVAS